MRKRELPTLLIVDNDAGSTEALQHTINHDGDDNEGVRAITAHSGDEALHIIRGESVAGVLDNICMPQMDGWQLHEALAHEAPDIPVALMSAIKPETGATHNKNVSILAKPFNINALFNVIEALVFEHMERACAHAIIELRAA